MRIIAGSRRGKKLAPVKGHAIRPTADRIRESIFNIISNRVPQAKVLDLFAGTGALGIEALSRGSQQAVFIDRNQAAIATIKKNLRVCRFESSARVIRWDISGDLNCIGSADKRFDIIFMDPPYRKGLIRSALSHLSRQGLTSSHTLIVVEHSLLEPIPSDLPEFNSADQRSYGKTLVSFLTCML